MYTVNRVLFDGALIFLMEPPAQNVNALEAINSSAGHCTP